jgi:hypothetical protein
MSITLLTPFPLAIPGSGSRPNRMPERIADAPAGGAFSVRPLTVSWANRFVEISAGVTDVTEAERPDRVGTHVPVVWFVWSVFGCSSVVLQLVRM